MGTAATRARQTPMQRGHGSPVTASSTRLTTLFVLLLGQLVAALVFAGIHATADPAPGQMPIASGTSASTTHRAVLVANPGVRSTAPVRHRPDVAGVLRPKADTLLAPFMPVNGADTRPAACMERRGIRVRAPPLA